MPIVVAICGMTGAGKSTVREKFEHHGFVNVHFGVVKETIKRHGTTSEELERAIRVELRQKHGMGAMAIIALPEIKGLVSSNQSVVIDNMYSWDEYKILKKEFGDRFISIAVHASPKTRYGRVAEREFRGWDQETSKKRDYAELEELDKGGPIAMADYHIVNEGAESELKRKVEEIVKEIIPATK